MQFQFNVNKQLTSKIFKSLRFNIEFISWQLRMVLLVYWLISTPPLTLHHQHDLNIQFVDSFPLEKRGVESFNVSTYLKSLFP